MEIKKLETKDIKIVVDLWYKVSIVAHDFVSADYWRDNIENMTTIHLPKSENYVAIEEDEIIGFIAMLDGYLAALFVDNKMQGKGVGKQLLNFIKEKRTSIQLSVYKKNTKSIGFYKSQGFDVKTEKTDDGTGELELLMEWKKLS